MYLFKNRMTINKFCVLIGYSRNQISGIINGKLIPSLRLAKLIEQTTNGEVTVEQLLKNKEAE